MTSLLPFLRALVALGRGLARLRGLVIARRSEPDEDPHATELRRRAAEALGLGRREEAATLYRQVLQRRRHDTIALAALRDLAVADKRWDEAVALEQRLVALAVSTERARESGTLAAMYCERGREELARGDAPSAIVHLKNAVRADRRFVPAALALGEAHEAAGDRREAVRVWERAVEVEPSLPLLARLERVYRREGRPSRLIAVYRNAVEQAPDDLGLALALGRVYFELEMLDEAAEQFEKVEVRAPDSPAVHAFLGAVFERRGEAREAFEEYRRALALGQAFDWPHCCSACGAVTATWEGRCRACHRWNTLRPSTTGR